MKTIRVAPLPQQMNWPPTGAAVVIDVLRATTVITQAIRSGAAEVAVCGEIDEAFGLADLREPRPLLCGERACKPIAGFDLGNSPSEYTQNRVAGKRLVMTTTNGTRAAIAAAGFDTIFAASFNNLSAVVDSLAGQSGVSILCAGTDGEVTEEDMLLAGAIIDRLLDHPSWRSESGPVAAFPLGPTETAARTLWRQHIDTGRTLAERLAETLGGRNLVAAGYPADITTCAQIDTTDTVPTVTHRRPITFEPSPGRPARQVISR
jgi:2-phosphosulfolactate phosphatase